MLFDWTISIGAILNIIAFIVVGTGFVYTMRDRMESLSNRLHVLEEDIKTLITILIQQGKQEERMTAMDARVANQGARLDDITRRFNDKTDKL